MSGPEILVAELPSEPQKIFAQEDPAVSLDSQGNVFVVWERQEDQVLADRTFDVVGARFDAGDITPGEMPEVQSGTFATTDPLLANDGTDGEVLVYHRNDFEVPPGCVPPDSFGKVRAVRYSGGSVAGGGQVHPNAGGGRRGALGMSPNGNYVVAYESTDCLGLNVEAGTKITRFVPTIRAPLELPGLFSELPLAVDIGNDGRVVALVADGRAGFCDTSSPCPFVAHRFDGAGMQLDPIVFTTYANTGVITTFDPAVAVTPDGGFVVVWVRLNFNQPQTLFVVGRRFGPDGSALGPEFEVSEGVVPDGSQLFIPPSLGMDDTGRFAVSFGVEGKAYVRLYDADANPLAPPIPVTERPVRQARLALSSNGQGVVTYLDEEQTVWYRRFGFTVAPGPDCTPDGQTLCLSNGRFRVRGTWSTSQGTSGEAQAVPLTSDTGYFWFFDDDNVEVVLKVLNACSFADRFWVFVAGLTNVEVEITVEDTQEPETQIYRNPQGRPFQPILDINAFATCP